MKVRYFEKTDTLFLELMPLPVFETKDIGENATLDLDAEGNICAITIEHASRQAGIPQCSYEKISA